MKLCKRISAFLLSFLLVGAMSLPSMAAEAEYTYKVRFFGGVQGTVEGGEVKVFENLRPGDQVTFNQSMVTLKNDSKYYVKGIRESGKDNNTVTSMPSFTVQEDMDYVVAYGVLGDSVAYTINYHDRQGRELIPSERFYGNVGDQAVVAYKYIQGYQPQAYNLGRTLSRNEADNVFTFIYTRVTTPAPTPTPNPGGGSGGGGDDDDGGGAGGGGTAAPAPAPGGDAGAGAGAADGGAGVGGAAGGADGAGAADGGAAADEATGGPADPNTEDGSPEEFRQLDDGEVPLADLDGDEGDGEHKPDDFAVLLAIPFSAKVGIVSAVLLIVGFAGWLLLGRRKKKEAENE